MAKANAGGAESHAASVTVGTRLTVEQRDRMKAKGEAAGLEMGPYLRKLVLDDLGDPEEASGKAKAERPTKAPSTAPPEAPPPLPAHPIRELITLKNSVDLLRDELTKRDLKVLVSLVRDELVKRDPKDSIDLLRVSLGHTAENVRELRNDVATALRVVMLFVAGLDDDVTTQLTEEKIDELLAEAFPRG